MEGDSPMADLFQIGTTPNGSPADLSVSDVAGLGPGAGTDLGTGDLRRKYNFGVTEFQNFL